MSEKLFLFFLILCGIWFFGVPGIIANEEIIESTDFLVRHKRVVSYLPGEDVPIRMTMAPYVVRIRHNMRTICTGSILSLYVVISSAPCIPLMRPENFDIVVASAHTKKNDNIHNVTEIRRRIENPHQRILNYGVALVIVSSQFVYNAYCRPIRLHIGPVLVGSFGKIHGWGFNFRSPNRGTNHITILRSIEVPIMLHENCVNRYRPEVELSQKTVCTYHPQRHSGHVDFGAGLVVDNTLAGVFLWSGPSGNINPDYPEVFASLQDPFYNQWIRSNLESIDLHFQNMHHH